MSGGFPIGREGIPLANHAANGVDPAASASNPVIARYRRYKICGWKPRNNISPPPALRRHHRASARARFACLEYASG